MNLAPHDPPHDFAKNNVFGLESLDVPIYRIFPKQWLVKSVKDKQLALRKPGFWKDPFENFLLTRKVKLDGQNVSIAEFQERLYGQCWSLCKESDAMWRIYSPESAGDGIKVKTTARKLFNVLTSVEHRYAPLRYFIGKVEYLDQQQLVEYFSDPKTFKAFLLDGTARGPVVALLFKRKEFSHEQEVRLVFQCDKTELKDETKYFPMDPNSLFEEMEFDPRILDPKIIAIWEQEFRALGFKNPIRQSPLYRLPTTTVKLD